MIRFPFFMVERDDHMPSRIGDNIHMLRSFYGDRAQGLADMLCVTRQCLNLYENGKRCPDDEIVRDIASHYYLTPDEAMYEDIPALHKKYADTGEAFKLVGDIFPVIRKTSDDTESAHEELIKDVERMDFSSLSVALGILSEYEEKLSDGEDAMVAGNCLSLMCLISFVDKVAWKVVKLKEERQGDFGVSKGFTDKTGLDWVEKVTANRRKAQRVGPEDIGMYRLTIGEMMGKMDPERVTGLRDRCLQVLFGRDGDVWLGNYFMALSLIWEVTDNGRPMVVNRRTGFDMMVEYAGAGNPFAKTYVDLFRLMKNDNKLLTDVTSGM